MAQSRKRLILEFGSGHDTQIYMNEVWRGEICGYGGKGEKTERGKKKMSERCMRLETLLG